MACNSLSPQLRGKPNVLLRRGLRNRRRPASDCPARRAARGRNRPGCRERSRPMAALATATLFMRSILSTCASRRTNLRSCVIPTRRSISCWAMRACRLRASLLNDSTRSLSTPSPAISIPVHLLTREAFEIYFRHLEAGRRAGVAHFESIFESAAGGGVGCAGASEGSDSREQRRQSFPGNLFGGMDSAGQPAGFCRPAADAKRGAILLPVRSQNLWTDNYSSLFRILK